MFPHRMENNKSIATISLRCPQVWNLSKEQKSRSTQIQSDTQRRRSQMEKNLKRSIRKKYVGLLEEREEKERMLWNGTLISSSSSSSSS